MKSKAQSPKSKVQSPKQKFLRLAASPLLRVLLLLLTAHCSPLTAFAQNDLQKIRDGGFVKSWLISNSFPAEIDAGAWENFNRFNIETLPEKDWLAPFGGVQNIKPSIGTFKATVQTQSTENTKSKIQNLKSGDPLPEVGVASIIKVLPDAPEIIWREVQLENPRIDFFGLNNGKNVGTAYAASYISSDKDENRFVETDGFLGSIWLNGEKIYDGFVLNAPRKATANFRKGKNLLLVRVSGISGDYWRKNGGFSALVRFWNGERSLNKSLESVSSPANGTIFYLEGFHVDPVYLQDQRGYSRITLSNTNQYVNSLRADPKYGVFLSEIDYLKPYLDTHPEDRDFLRETVRQGRVGSGGAYNQFNELTIGGESIIRNILYGQTMHEAMLGRRAKSLSLWDVFGHAPQISQIAQKSGFNGIAWSKKITGFQPFFLDYALDGSRLPHRRVDYAYSFSGFGSGKNYTLDNFRQTTERKFQETQTFNSAFDLRINAADFTPPWTNLAGNVEKLETNKPQIRVTGQAQDLYFEQLNEEIKTGKVKPPLTSRDKLFFHVGVMAARSDLKIGQRLSENMTLTAEKFGAIAYLGGAKNPDLALDKAWRQIFFGSHHDAITGTPSDSAFLDLVHGYREAFELSKDAIDDSLDFIAKQINTNPKFKIQNPKSNVIPIIVFNPMSWKKTDVVRVFMELPKDSVDFVVLDENGKQIEYRAFAFNFPRLNLKNSLLERKKTAEFEFVAKDVSSVGYKTFYVQPLSAWGEEKNKRNETLSIENEFYKIKVEPEKGGAISSVYDKKANREIVNTANGRYANEIAVLKEELTKKNVIYPAWEFWTTGEKRFSAEKPATVSSYKRGDTETLAITGELTNVGKFTQLIELHGGVKRINFKTELVDYKGKDELFVVNFPLNLTGGALVTEDRFGTVVRNGSKGFLDFRTNTDKLVSGAPVYAVNNWAEYGSTLNLNFVDASGKSISSVPFKPTALIRPHGENYENLTETIVSNLIKRGVSVTPFFDDNDEARRKNLSIEDSTMPKKLNDDVAYHSFRIALGGEKENLYSAALIKQISAETRTKFDERLTRDGFAYLFIYDRDVPKDWSAIPTLLIAGDAKKAIEKLLAPISEDKFSLTLSTESLVDTSNLPQVPDYGVALINNGTPAVSLENPNTLTLFLTHTAIFPGVNLPFDFVPENKTHVFTYALYPHQGSWREADTVKVGEDFNNPLIAVQTDVHDGELPGEKSFLSVDKENVVVSALKLGGNPQANFRSIYKENERPLFVRFYETQGQKTNPMFTLGQSGWEFGQVGLLEGNAADTLRSSGNGFGTAIKSFSIETFSLKPTKFETQETSRQTLGTTKEIVQPVSSRYWLHNSGAAPIGNDAVKVTLRPFEQMGELSCFAYDDKYNLGGTTTVAVRVQVVNNYQDRNYKGEVRLEVPEDWRVVPEKLSFDIAPNGSFVKDAIVVAFPVKRGLEFDRASGLVKARIEHEGQTFQDVLQIGKPFKLDWTTEKTVDGVSVKIKNPNRQTIEGAIALIAPPELWAFGKSTFPREQGFSIVPNAEFVLKFETDKLSEGAWKIARIVYNGNVDYKRADGK
jgi:alpha-mannosidase